MKIKRIISQYRRDLQCEYECEHCGHTYESFGRIINKIRSDT